MGWVLLVSDLVLSLVLVLVLMIGERERVWDGV